MVDDFCGSPTVRDMCSKEESGHQRKKRLVNRVTRKDLEKIFKLIVSIGGW